MIGKLSGDKYLIDMNGNEYTLPVVPISDTTSIVVYDMLNNPQLVYDSADELSVFIHYKVGWDNIDVIVTPECKCIPLAYELAKTYKKDLVVIRKAEKLYNPSAVSTEVKSITTDKVQNLYLSQDSYQSITGRRVLIVDDVISTGESLRAVENLLNQVPNAEIVGRAFVFSEGDVDYEFPIIALGNLPLITKES